MRAFKKVSFDKMLPWLLIVGGVIALLCSLVITLDKIKLLENPNFRPNCDLNPVISCGSVMSSEQSHVFGLSNSLIGLIAFPVLITIGVAMLSGATFKRWFWLGMQAGTAFGVIFVHWLAFQSLYRIGALCPYCIVVWAVTITTFWYISLYNFQHKYIVVKGWYAKIVSFKQRHHLDILILWLLTIAILILNRFWYYYGPKLGF